MKNGYGGDYKEEEKQILEILKEKHTLGRNDLMIVFYSIRLEDASQLYGFEPREEGKSYDIIELQMKNYDKLVGDLSYMNDMNFFDLLSYTNNEIPSDFHEKYTNIKTVRINQYLSGMELIWKLFKFCQSSKGLVNLIFEGSMRRPRFFKAMAPLVPQIKMLSIAEFKFMNFDFIFEFKKLRSLAIFAQDIPVRVIKKVFEKFDEFKLFNHTLQGSLCMEKMWSKEKGIYEFAMSSEFGRGKKKFDSLEPMIEEIKKVRKAYGKSCSLKWAHYVALCLPSTFQA